MVFDRIRRKFIEVLASMPFLQSASSVSKAASHEPDGRVQAASWARSHAPGCLSPFLMALDETEGSRDLTPISASFRLACKKCKSTQFSLGCYPKLVKASDDYAGLKEGDVFERNPHHASCKQCGDRQLLFDSNKHGYDGALGNGGSYERGRGKEQPIICKEASYGIVVRFIFNVELSELHEIASEDGLQPQDLFDGISIEAMSANGSILKSLDYECA